MCVCMRAGWSIPSPCLYASSAHLCILQGTVLDDEDLLESINVAAFPDGEEVFFELLFGNSITYEDGNIVAARAMTQVRGINARTHRM